MSGQKQSVLNTDDLATLQLPQCDRRLVEVARAFVPRIRELAPQMHANRRLDDALVEDMERAGLFSVLVPKRWGGVPVPLMETMEIIEVLGEADCSTAWVASFYMLHNWFLCKFPLEVQEKIFRDTNSVRAPAVFGPPGTAERVSGGFRISGRWPYATGAWHASHVLVPAMLGSALHWFLMRREEVGYIDDWHMEAMSATGSITIAARDVFVADGWHMDVAALTAAWKPDEALHEEAIFRLPFTVLSMIPNSLCVGALDRAVNLAREKLPNSRPLGIPRIEFPAARIRWAEAYSRARVMRMIRNHVVETSMAQALSGQPITPEDEASTRLDVIYYTHGIKDALRHLVDGLGSSTYKRDDPIFRMAQDIGAVATHAHGSDYDVLMDRHARCLLGIGPEPGDPATLLD